MPGKGGSYQQILERTFSKYQQVSANSLQYIFERCSTRSFLKNETVIAERRPDGNEYFLLTGIMHAYSVTPEGEQATTRIFMPESVITPHIVCTFGGNSIQSYSCLQDVVLAIISMKEFNSVMGSHTDIRAFGYKVVETELAAKTQREVSLLTLTAKERLLRFRKEYPGLENLVPHTVIASFLGITPVSFSRLRNELASLKE